MINRIRRLLGWDAEPEAFEVDDFGPRASAAVTPRPPNVPRARPATTAPPRAAGDETGRPEKSPLERLDNPGLSLDTSDQAGFDPYNTGAFDRSASWDRISKTKSR